MYLIKIPEDLVSWKDDTHKKGDLNLGYFDDENLMQNKNKIN